MSDYLSNNLYQTIIDNTPIVCVDIIPVRKRSETWQIGIIVRATSPEAGKSVLIGGRIRRNELIENAISRHLMHDCNISSYRFIAGISTGQPLYVQQYLNQNTATGSLGYDPSKHAIGLTYLVEISDLPLVQNEAKSFHWIDKANIPESAGYNQDILMRKAFKYLNLK